MSLRATSSSSSWVTPARLLPFGKYWRRRPLVFSFDPRCHGSGDRRSRPRHRSRRKPPVLGHLLSLIPGQRPAKLFGQRPDARLERLADRFGVGSLGQRDELAIAGLALDQGHDRRARPISRLPSPSPDTDRSPTSGGRSAIITMPGNRPALPALRVRPGEALLTPGPQMPVTSAAATRAPGRTTRGRSSRADLHLAPRRGMEPQRTPDLLRRVILPQALDHKLTQLAAEARASSVAGVSPKQRRPLGGAHNTPHRRDD